MPIINLNSSNVHPETGEVRIRFIPTESTIKRKNTRKQRIIEMRAFVNGLPNAALIDQDLSIIFLKDGAPLSHSGLQTEAVYERKKGPKILTQIVTTENVRATCPNHVLLAYDMLVAIDTNTLIIRDVSVSISYCLQFVLKKNGGGVEMFGFNPHCWEFNDVIDKPENYSWRELIKTILSSQGYSPSMRIAIVVDSDLGNLGQYNARQKPICDNFYLPDNIMLVYASSDVGTTEYAANGVMRFCDEQAKQIFELRKSPLYEPLPKGSFRTYKLSTEPI